MAFTVQLWANKWNIALRDNNILNYITTTEFTKGKVQGDRVKISKLSGLTVQNYVKGTSITYNNISSTDTDVIMDKNKLIAGVVEDIDEAQTNPSIMQGIITEAVGMANEQIVTDVLAQMVADGTGDITLSAALTESNIKSNLLVPARAFLNTAKAPQTGRFMIVDPVTESLMQGLNLTNNAEGLACGLVGNIMGMDIFVSNLLPANKCIVGQKDATSFGASLSTMKTMPSESQVGEILQVLEVYGSKSHRPECIAEVSLYVAPSNN